jgi:hypothetical protein
MDAVVERVSKEEAERISGPIPPRLEKKFHDLELAIERGKTKAFWAGFFVAIGGLYLGQVFLALFT